jgi:hypothetical protein
VASWRPAIHDGKLTLLAPSGTVASAHELMPTASQPAAAFASASALREAAAVASGHHGGRSLGYLDVTINGEASARLWSLVEERTRAIGNVLLGVPVKLRRAPAAYHSTEQSEMDGPPSLVSLRIVARETEACLLGRYTSAFLHAQAVSTWQAMREAGRLCYLLVIEGALEDANEQLAAFFSQVEVALRQT